MKPILQFILIAIFSVFIGSQITEGILLLPYWQSLSINEFYVYYNNFGHIIGDFYTVLTVIAVLIPLFVAIYCKIKRLNGFNFALLSTLFAFIFLVTFYIYFKEANELFFKSVLNKNELKNELIIWGYWHWGRVIIECFSLLFLIFAFNKMKTK
jgi:hypothetical protein